MVVRINFFNNFLPPLKPNFRKNLKSNDPKIVLFIKKEKFLKQKYQF